MQEEVQIGGQPVPSVKFRVRMPGNGGAYRYFNVRALGKTAIAICEKYAKGTPIELEGSLDSYVKESGGQKTEYVTINAQRVSGVGAVKKEAQAAPPPALPPDFQPAAAAKANPAQASFSFDPALWEEVS